MTENSDELLALSERLGSFAEHIAKPEIGGPLSRLQDVASEVGRAWSGSWIGYHAYVYYEGLQPPPPGARFSQEWGLMEQVFIRETRGNWREFDPEAVKRHIRSEAGNPDLSEAEELETRARRAFEEAQAEIDSILTTVLSERDDPFLSKLKEEAADIKLASPHDIVRVMRPSGGYVMTRDTTALGQGFYTPPHVSITAEAMAIRNTVDACTGLSKIARRAGSHIAKQQRRNRRKSEVGTNVFIGHGRSSAWMELKDFVQDRLRLPWDEFNRVPVAGVTNVARLSEMLDDAAIAFLIMTAEDEQADGQMTARQNVIHEAGLFQGRLGFTRAIVLLEDGCQEFSNIQGLGQIRFPKGNIKAAFEDVRLVLEREGLITANSQDA
jgi:predicted nucleotide-binding protein